MLQHWGENKPVPRSILDLMIELGAVLISAAAFAAQILWLLR